MTQTYFHRVAKETGTRVWVNNATGLEMDQAIEDGAINMTANPSYASKLIKTEPAYVRDVIDNVVRETEEDDEAAYRAYEVIMRRALDRFLPLYEQSAQTCGYVTFQGDPRRDDDADRIVHEIVRFRKLGPNVMAKIPVTLAGARAIESLIAEGVPICATEVFSVSQAVYACELYRRVVEKSGKHPPFYVTHITGIFDEHLSGLVERDSIDIAPEALSQAGCTVARKEYRLLKERGYPVTMLGGGARGTQHFTEFVGGDLHITINWSMARSLIDQDPPLESRIDAETPEVVVKELCEKLPDVRRAYFEDALAPQEYAEFGGVQCFRNMFLAGYGALLKEISERRMLRTDIGE